ncbi:MAG: hypothetical protein B6D36_17640 [Planctomycetes bacterium UTPLA1]|nr:MAG: hypothetical protein B6D36_17640 [Planctomycetes bacterium UTPLA1]
MQVFRSNRLKAIQDPLDAILLQFIAKDGSARFPWTIRDSLEGTQIIGATGAGKSTGSGEAIAIPMLEHGFGGLVLTTKPDDADCWLEYARRTGRLDDVRVIDASGRERFNFLDYERQSAQEVNLVRNIVHVLLTAVNASGDRDQATEAFWVDALEALLTNGFDLDVLAHDSTQLPRTMGLIRSAPRSRRDLQSHAWRLRSACWQALERAASREHTPARAADLVETCEYFLREFADLADRTRSVVVTSVLSKVSLLLRSPFREIFCAAEPSTITPDDSHRGAIIIVNLPIKRFGKAGRFAQLVIKAAWQRATERRATKLKRGTPEFDPKQRPVFLWADEAQHFVTEEDMLFQQTARSAQAASVYLTQNISNYHAQFHGAGGRAIADSILGGFQTKIFHQNGDPLTCEWAERLFGYGPIPLGSRAVSGPSSSFTRTNSETFLPLVPAKSFATLKKGGPQNNRIVEAIVFQGGRTWDSERQHILHARFQQRERSY